MTMTVGKNALLYKVFEMEREQAMTIGKKELALLLAEKRGHIGKVARYMTLIDDIADVIIEALRDNHKLEIRGFIILTPYELPERIARNPKTGEPAVVCSRRKVKFQMGKTMREALNEG